MESGTFSIQILRVTLGIDHFSMEISSRTKAELIKPVFLAVGIPLAFSLASIILEKIRAKKSSCLKASPPDIHVNASETNSHEISGDGIFILEDTQVGNSGKEENSGLRSKVEELQEREMMMEARFLRYHELKVQEFVIMEIESSLLLELARDEFMDMEVSLLMEGDDDEKFEEMVKVILKAVEEIEFSRSENVMVQQKVKKFLMNLKGRMRAISEKDLRIEEMEGVILSKDAELVRKSDIIKKLEDETKEMRMAVQSLQQEKNELLKKLGMAENLALTKKSEKEKETMKEYDQVLNELERLQKDRAAETKELIYLRWSYACLKHKLFRMNQEQEGKPEAKKTESDELQFGSASGEMSGFGFENESNSSSFPHVDPSIDPTVVPDRGSQSHGQPKRRKIYEKFKKWVEGGGGGEKVRKNKVEEKKKKPDLKLFGRHSVADCGEETYFPAATKLLTGA